MILLSAGVAAAIGGCGAGAGTRSAPAGVPSVPPVSSSLAGSCRDVAARELADVARRVYAQAVTGQGVTSAVRRLQRSDALAAAVASGDRARVTAAFLPIRHQIVRIELYRGTRRVYAYGTFPTFAPIRGTLRRGGAKVGRFVIATTDQRAYSGFVRRLTGAMVTFHRARSAARPQARRVVSLATRSYPSGGPLRIDLRFQPPAGALCGTTNAQTRLNTIGYVARRLIRAEQSSRSVRQTVRHVAADPAFRRATAKDDRPAIRSAIIRSFFHYHSLHIVRVRVTRGARLVYDLGGPYVLEPVHGTVRSPDGRTAATFAVAVQDDTGYIKLVHRFTGAEVQLVSPLGKVPGSSLAPGPNAIPAHGTVSYRGRRYLAYSFDGTAFPAGVLRVSILVPA